MRILLPVLLVVATDSYDLVISLLVLSAQRNNWLMSWLHFITTHMPYAVTVYAHGCQKRARILYKAYVHIDQQRRALSLSPNIDIWHLQARSFMFDNHLRSVNEAVWTYVLNHPNMSLEHVVSLYGGLLRGAHFVPSYLLINRSFDASSYRTLLQDDRLNSLRRSVVLYLQVLLQRRHLLVGDEAFLPEIVGRVRGELVDHADESNTYSRSSVPLFDQSFVDLLDDVVGIFIHYVGSSKDEKVFRERIHAFSEALSRSVLAMMSSPDTSLSDSEGVYGYLLTPGIFEQHLMDYLFDQEEVIVYKILQHDKTSKLAGSFVARACGRSFLYGLVSSEWSQSSHHPILAGFTVGKAQRLSDAYHCFLQTSEFFAALLSHASWAFDGDSGSHRNLYKALIRDIIRLVLSNYSYPKTIYEDNNLRDFARDHGLHIEPRTVYGLRLLDMFQLLYLWSYLPQSQQFLHAEQPQARFSALMDMIAEVLYWQAEPLCDYDQSVNMVHSQTSTLIESMAWYVFDFQSGRPSMPIEMLEFLQGCLAIQHGHSVPLTQKIQCLSHSLHFLDVMDDLLQSDNLLQRHWRLDNIAQLIDQKLILAGYPFLLASGLQTLQRQSMLIDFLSILIPAEEDVLASHFACLRIVLTSLRDSLTAQHTLASSTGIVSMYSDDEESQSAFVLPDSFCEQQSDTESSVTYEETIELILQRRDFARSQLLTAMVQFSSMHQDALQRFMSVHRLSLLGVGAYSSHQLWATDFPSVLTHQEIRLALEDCFEALCTPLSHQSLVLAHAIYTEYISTSKFTFLASCIDKVLLDFMRQNRPVISRVYSSHKRFFASILQEVLLKHELSSWEVVPSEDEQLIFWQGVLEAYHADNLVDNFDELLTAIADCLRSLDGQGFESKLQQAVHIFLKSLNNNYFVEFVDFSRRSPVVHIALKRVLSRKIYPWVYNMDNNEFVADKVVGYLQTHINILAQLSTDEFKQSLQSWQDLSHIPSSDLTRSDLIRAGCGFAIFTPGVLDAFLSQIQDDQSVDVRRSFARAIVTMAKQKVVEDKQVSARSRLRVDMLSMHNRYLYPLEDLICFSMTNPPQHPQAKGAHFGAHMFTDRSSADYIRDIVWRFKQSPVIGLNLCLDSVTSPYKLRYLNRGQLQNFFSQVEACTKDHVCMQLVVSFVNMLNNTWIVPRMVKECMEKLFTNPQKGRWYASLAQIILSLYSCVGAIFSPDHRSELGLNMSRLRASLWYFMATPIQLIFTDPRELLLTLAGWLFFPLMVLQYAVTSAVHAIGDSLRFLYYYAFSIFKKAPKSQRPIPPEPLARNLAWALLGVWCCTALVLHLGGFLIFTSEHCGLAVLYASAMVAAQNAWSQLQTKPTSMFLFDFTNITARSAVSLSKVKPGYEVTSDDELVSDERKEDEAYVAGSGGLIVSPLAVLPSSINNDSV